MTKPRAVIVHPGGLGDVLLSVPAIRYLRQSFPSHELVLISERQVAGLLLACGKVDLAYPLDSSLLAELLAGVDCLSGRSRDRLAGCDLTVVWQADPDGACASALQRLGIKRIIVESPFSSRLRTNHQSERFLETLSPSASIREGSSSLQLPDEVLELGRSIVHCLNIRGPIAAVHPGSGSSHKCCSPESLAATIDGLQRAGLTPVVVQGPADATQVQQVMAKSHAPIPLLRDLELRVMAGVLAYCGLFLGHDSGLTHLASCLDVPTIALFGPTNPSRWAPLGRRVTVVAGSSCICTTSEMVRLCAEKPCLRIPSEQVLAACLQTLETEQESGNS